MGMLMLVLVFTPVTFAATLIPTYSVTGHRYASLLLSLFSYDRMNLTMLQAMKTISQCASGAIANGMILLLGRPRQMDALLKLVCVPRHCLLAD